MCHLSAQPHTSTYTCITQDAAVYPKMCRAILTEHAKRGVILVLSYIHTHTHTCIQVHNIICSYITKDAAFRQRTLEEVPFLHSVAHKHTHAYTHKSTAHVAVCPKMCLLTLSRACAIIERTRCGQTYFW